MGRAGRLPVHLHSDPSPQNLRILDHPPHDSFARSPNFARHLVPVCFVVCRPINSQIEVQGLHAVLVDIHIVHYSDNSDQFDRACCQYSQVDLQKVQIAKEEAGRS